MPTSLSADVLATLRKYDTPTICNVIEIFDVRPRNTGYMNDRIKSCFPEMGPIVGYASTATWRADAPPAGTGGYGSLDGQVAGFAEIPGPPIVVFQDLDEPTAAASFGEVMCTAYKAFGAVGLITSGAARDLDQVRDMGFPAFSNGAIASHGYGHIVSLHVPVHVGGMAVHPGDLLHADANGVSSIPNGIAAAVADASAEYVAAEQVVLDYLNTGDCTPKGLEASRKECAALIQDLTARVRS